MVKKYKTKPCEIEAIQWTGNNVREILFFMGKLKSIKFNLSCKIEEEYWYSYRQSIVDNGLIINTLEGDMKANIGDYIIKGLTGEFYPCKPDVFHKKYEVVENNG